MLTWFDPDRTGLTATNGIVRAHEMATVMATEELLALARKERDAILASAAEEALAIVDKAQRRAEDILSKAQEQAAHLMEDASTQFRGELERGHSEGQQLAATEWHQRHAELLAAQTGGQHAPERKLAELVALAAERVVHAEPREALFRRSLETVQSLLQRTGTVTLRVNDTDLDQARAAVAGWPSAAQRNGLVVEVQCDTALSPGSCFFESEIGTLDASLDIQLAGLRGALDRAVSQILDDSESDEYDPESSEDFTTDDHEYTEQHLEESHG